MLTGIITRCHDTQFTAKHTLALFNYQHALA